MSEIGPDNEHSPLYRDLDSVLLAEEQIQERVGELGKLISRDFAGKDLLMMSVLKGAVVFLADIARFVDIHVEYGFVKISTYCGGTCSSKEPSVEEQEVFDLEGKDVLLVEDVLDTGKTIAHAKEWAVERGASSVSTCVLLAKEGYKNSAFPNPDYVGFTIPNVFVVGYGLDYREKYRNLRCVGVLSPRIYAPEDRPGETQI